MKAQIICFKCILKDKLGTVLSSSVNRDVLTALPGDTGPLTGLAKALQGLSKGERRSISLSADQAYGFYDPRKNILMPRKRISQGGLLRAGQTVSVLGKDGEVRSFRVIQSFGDMVSLDANHPLAGQDLVFEIETLEARDATEEEVFEALNPVEAQLLH